MTTKADRFVTEGTAGIVFHPPEEGEQLSTAWDESKHPRDAGKFTLKAAHAERSKVRDEKFTAVTERKKHVQTLREVPLVSSSDDHAAEFVAAGARTVEAAVKAGAKAKHLEKIGRILDRAGPHFARAAAKAEKAKEAAARAKEADDALAAAGPEPEEPDVEALMAKGGDFDMGSPEYAKLEAEADALTADWQKKHDTWQTVADRAEALNEKADELAADAAELANEAFESHAEKLDDAATAAADELEGELAELEEALWAEEEADPEPEDDDEEDEEKEKGEQLSTGKGHWVTLKGDPGQHAFIGPGGKLQPGGPGSEPVEKNPAKDWLDAKQARKMGRTADEQKRKQAEEGVLTAPAKGEPPAAKPQGPPQPAAADKKQTGGGYKQPPFPPGSEESKVVSQLPSTGQWKQTVETAFAKTHGEEIANRWEAMCDTVTPVLQKYLKSKGIETKMVQGTYRLGPDDYDDHVWLETANGMVIDGALPQYHESVDVGQIVVWPSRPRFYQEGEGKQAPRDSASPLGPAARRVKQ